MRRRLPGGRRGALPRVLRAVRRDLPGTFAGAAVVACSTAALHMGILLHADAEAASERSYAEAGLDVVLCLEGAGGCDAETLQAAEEAVLRTAREAGGEARRLPSQQVRDRVAGGDERLLDVLDVAGLPSIVSVDVPSERRNEVRQHLNTVEGVAGVQVRNLQLLLLAEQAAANGTLLLALGAVQALAAAGTLTALTTGAVRRRKESTGLMRMLGAPERLLRRPHLLRGGTVGALGAGAGYWAGAASILALQATSVPETFSASVGALWAIAGGVFGALVARASVGRRRRAELPL